MWINKLIYAGLLASTLLGAIGCSNLPGSKGSQGAVIGGLGGAAAGAAIGGEKHRLLGAILGGAVGAGGGYVIGANSDKIMGKDTQGATQAQQQATQNPATAAQARTAATADINRDGFVTLDEVVALRQAGLTDSQMLSKLRATDQVFELTTEQEKYLRDNGISQNVIAQMETINQDKRQQILNQRGDVIGRSPSSTSSTYPSSTYPR
jgi:Glycine zipper 2TM domain